MKSRKMGLAFVAGYHDNTNGSLEWNTLTWEKYQKYEFINQYQYFFCPHDDFLHAKFQKNWSMIKEG